MTLPSPGLMPPITLSPPPTWIARSSFPSAIVPVGSVPMWLPCTIVTLETSDPPRTIPMAPFAEITFPAPGAEPPIVTWSDSDIDALEDVAEGSGSRDVHADVVAGDHDVGRRVALDVDPAGVVARHDVAGGRRGSADRSRSRLA